MRAVFSRIMSCLAQLWRAPVKNGEHAADATADPITARPKSLSVAGRLRPHVEHLRGQVGHIAMRQQHMTGHRRVRHPPVSLSRTHRTAPSSGAHVDLVVDADVAIFRPAYLYRGSGGE